MLLFERALLSLLGVCIGSVPLAMGALDMQHKELNLLPSKFPNSFIYIFLVTSCTCLAREFVCDVRAFCFYARRKTQGERRCMLCACCTMLMLSANSACKHTLSHTHTHSPISIQLLFCRFKPFTLYNLLALHKFISCILRCWLLG